MEMLRNGLTANVGSKPFQIPDILGEKLYDYLFNTAAIKLKGSQFASLHPHGIGHIPSKPSGKRC